MDGIERARYLVSQLLEDARRMRAVGPLPVTTDYVNTLPSDDDPFPGDEAMEDRIEDIVRWNAAVTVAKADPPAPKPAAVAPKPASKTVAKPTPPAPKPEPAPAVEPEPTVVAAVVEPAPVAEPAVEDAEPVATAEVVPAVATTASASGTASPDPSNYAVGPGNRIVVQAAETLGHYAEWLDVRASDLRRLNGLRYGTPVVIGRRLKLDLSRVGAEAFEARRLAYHRSIQEEFFGAYNVTGTESHTLRKGDTLWYLAQRKYRVPVWLLRQYNPDLDFGALPAGASMVIPQIEARSS